MKLQAICFFDAVKVILRGMGQVVFLDNALSGAFILLGFYLNSPIMCALALLSTIVSTLTAVLLKCDSQAIRNGLYGFNGTLVGVAVPCFLIVGAWSVALLIVASGLSTWVAHILRNQRLLPGLTAPFVVITWGVLLLTTAIPEFRPVEVAASVPGSVFNPLKAFSLGFGQIMLQGNSVATGLLFLLAFAVNSLKMALKATFACVVSLIFVWLPFVDVNTVNNGLMGYNAILAFVAVTDVVAISSFRSGKAVIALLLSFVFQCLGMLIGLVTLTAPFVLAVWIVMLLDKWLLCTTTVTT